MSRYAEATTVSAEQSRAEIEKTLIRYGASQFAYGWAESSAMIGFEVNGRKIKFNLPMPDRSKFEETAMRGIRRSPKSVENAYQKAVRQRWRALALCIKAKLEAVSAGITQLEEEFYAHIVMPGGRTIYETTREQVAIAYKNGKIGPLLLEQQ